MARVLAAVPPAVCSDSNDHVLARTFRVPARTTVLCVFATSALCRAAALSFLAGRMAVELDRGRSQEQVDNCRADALLRRAGRSQTGSDAVFLCAGAIRAARGHSVRQATRRSRLAAKSTPFCFAAWQIVRSQCGWNTSREKRLATRAGSRSHRTNLCEPR